MRRFDHSGRYVDAGYDCAGCGDLPGERSVTAAKIEDGFAGLRRQQFDDATGKVSDKTASCGIG
jgi:hypothetical protein